MDVERIGPPSSGRHHSFIVQGQHDSPHSATDISSLPVEILCSIFKSARATTWKATETSPLPSQVLLTHVSRHWRAVAINMPTLWTVIDVHTSWHARGLLDAHITRSRPHLLYISLRWDHIDENIGGCSDRWIVFRGSFSGWSRLGLFVDHVLAPNLEELYLSTPYPSSSRATLLAPRLSCLNLTGVSLSIIRPPLPAIRTCVINTGDHHDPIDLALLRILLSSSSQLTELSLGHEALPLESEPIHLPSLRSFQISAYDRQDVLSMCRALYVPALETFKLLGFDQGLLEAFLDFCHSTEHVHDRYPNLQSFFLLNTPLIPELMITLPFITSVVLGNADCECFECLCVDRQLPAYPSPLWPQLRSLTARHVRVPFENDLRGIVSSRIAAGCPLSSVAVSSSGSWRLDPRLRSWLQERVPSVDIHHVHSED